MNLDPATLAHIRAVAAEVRALADGDEDYVADSIEGATNAFEMLDALVDAAQHVASLEAAARERAQRLGDRARRLADQGKGYRKTMVLILEAMDLKKIVRPCATLSLTAGRASLEVTDPAAVPTQMRKPGEPDKAAIRAQIDAGVDVPGCRVVTGEPSLTMRIS